MAPGMIASMASQAIAFFSSHQHPASRDDHGCRRPDVPTTPPMRSLRMGDIGEPAAHEVTAAASFTSEAVDNHARTFRRRRRFPVAVQCRRVVSSSSSLVARRRAGWHSWPFSRSSMTRSCPSSHAPDVPRTSRSRRADAVGGSPDADAMIAEQLMNAPDPRRFAGLSHRSGEFGSLSQSRRRAPKHQLLRYVDRTSKKAVAAEAPQALLSIERRLRQPAFHHEQSDGRLAPMNPRRSKGCSRTPLIAWRRLQPV